MSRGHPLVFTLLCSLLFFTYSEGWSETDLYNQFVKDELTIDDAPFSCDNTCQLPILNNPALGGCGLDGNLYFNKLGNSSLSSYFQCLIKNIGQPNPNVGINYPGSCGCPNYCSNITNAGSCVNNECQCNSAWNGPDCSQGNDHVFSLYPKIFSY